jgi:serine/threonine protein kinase/class 3 adenylate cyclase
MTTGPYELLTQISAGHDGVAYRARRQGQDGPVELRMLVRASQDGVRWEQLKHRLQLARLFEHTGARRILEINLEAEPPQLALAGIRGVPMNEHFDGRLPLPPVEALAMVLDTAGVVAAAHRLGLGHGAIGPATVALESGLVQLDFTGTATHEDDQPGPPANADAMASDIAGLAGLMIWLQSGRKPSAGDTLPATVAGPVRVLAGDVLRCPAEERPGIGEFVDRLRQVIAVVQGQAGMDATNPSLEEVRETTHVRREPLNGRREKLGRFRLLEKLGQGGMGEVYRAVDASDGTVVAIKTLLPEFASKPEALRRFQKEAKLLAKVNNPYVANLLEENEDDGIHYLAVEFVAGQSVAKRLEGGKALEESFALAIIADVCRALVDAHERGIIHRDIKPENILLFAGADAGASLGAAPIAKLSDFGLARHVVETASLHMTRTGSVVGTPLYLSPEQCFGTDLDPRSDVYALGATLFHLLTGRPPFLGDSAVVLINHHCNTPPPPLKTLNPAVSDGACRIVEKALSKRPVHRHADASEMLRDIERVVRGQPTVAAVHPLMPATDPANVVNYDFQWDLASSPAELWPHVSNTERLNRAIHLPAVEFTTQPDATGKVRREGKIRKMGLEMAWEEHPFEWIEARRFGVLRQCRSGPLKWLMSMVELAPVPGGGTTLSHHIRVEPNGLIGRTFAAYEVGVKTRRALDRVYRRIDAAVAGKLAGATFADPFEEAARLSKAQQRRLDEALDGLVSRGVDPSLAERLGGYLATAPAQEVARIRPIALARRLGLNPEAVLAACLHGARAGLLVLLWDLLCPLCRIPSEIKDTLKALREHGRCEACNSDYELDFGQSVELIFRIHPSIREAELGTYCVGGPAHSPHVVAQVRVAAKERISLELELAQGAYRLRGPQLPSALEARIDPAGRTARWEVDLGRLVQQASTRIVLRPGGQVLEVHNPHEQELIVRLERMAVRDDAVTAARAASLALFRELFPGEVLSPGRLVSVATVTLLATEMLDSQTLAERSSEAEAFAVLHDHLGRVEALARSNGGALVKAIGDGALAAFHEPAAALRTAFELNRDGTASLRLALHRGPALAATINDHLDYFGAVVRQLGAILQQAHSGERLLSQAVMDDPPVSALLHERGLEGEVIPGEPVLHRFGANTEFP